MSGFSLTSGTGISGFDTSGLTVDPGESLYSLGNPNDNPFQASKSYSYLADESEAAKLASYYPTTDNAGNAAPWWQGLATYGATRAIDAAVGPKVNGSGGQQSTYAGADGKTYINGRLVNAPVNGTGGDLLPLLLLGGLAFLVLG